LSATKPRVEDHRFAALISIIALTGLVVVGVMILWCAPVGWTCSSREDIAQLGILIAASVSPFIALITIAFRDYFRVTEEAIKP